MRAGGILRCTLEKALGGLRESPDCLGQTVSRNLNFKNIAGEGSEGSEEHVSGNWKKGDPCYVVAESLTRLLPAVMWKEENINDKLGYMAKGEVGGSRVWIA